ncbi:MAG: DUF503 domain-containing protein [Syntrophales bacterium]|nr:DUF503 domain-containing protein [Syntrophales bacterium]MDD5231961.1 DUF503 domain-containing protein [Syntrophales bacterium]MDD5532259.1 DUF503 domain-containing protein [Syntrophales bacterium]HPL63626.1 DUF503 domain-containing protein [Syntrophales bacterium]
MVVGTGIVEIFVEESRSLKDKRAVVKSILRRTQNEFNISIAEIGDLDHWKKSRIGFSMVGNDRGFINSKVDKVLRFIEDLYLAQVLRSRIEISSLSDVLDPGGRVVHSDDDEKS